MILPDGVLEQELDTPVEPVQNHDNPDEKGDDFRGACLLDGRDHLVHQALCLSLDLAE